ncbi:rho GTPase-activating protein 22 isoform X1 [Tachysurus fulvidraco]|uniref:rho GTPase-activating protein 22 isoform X1 n=1 Tax=Tachysurus fulvidraco TaxID=1234273 RepID=UPI000F516BF2|nr:rho GTPase-activating protein 22 isoform X1 [Tachysurus fulvidraco]
MTTMLSPKIKQTRRARSKSMVMGEVSHGSAGSPGLHEGVLKAGWLKKQRSIMKNWQLRWFVLRSDYLYFYKDEEETKPQGCISLKGSQVNELTPNPEEAGRYLFEIVPGAAGEKDKTPVSHETFLLMANSQNDMDDWVKAIRRVIWAPLGGGIFGQGLEDTVQYEKKFGIRLVPLLVEQCVNFIRERGLDEEGLFRMPGQANLVKELQDAFDCGEKPQFDSNTDIHTVASLLKLYLRELPEPVIPFCKYDDFLTCAQLLAKDEEEGLQELEQQVKTLPSANYNLLKYICNFLDEVQSHSGENKMSVQNLATVFGPNILRPKMEDPVAIMEGTSLVQHLMTVLISKNDQLYADQEFEAPEVSMEVTSQCQQHQQSNLVDWISEEDLQNLTPPGKNPNTSDNPSSSSTSSLDGIPTGPSPKSAPLGKAETAISPSKQSKTLPSWKYTFKGSSPRPQPAKTTSQSSDVTSISSGNWLMNGLSSLRGHRRTSTGERAKDSGSSQRLSTYDNVTYSSSTGSVPNVESTQWSNLPCEILVSGRDTVEADTRTVSDENSVDPEMTVDEVNYTEQASADMVSTCSSDANIHNIVPVITVMAEDTDESATSLVSVVTALKEELNSQKLVYETRINKLEESSAMLRSQMERIEHDMEQERKKQRMLEIKLRNSERAREDAENRNRLLEKEMEDFFSTLGELALGTRTSDI